MRKLPGSGSKEQDLTLPATSGVLPRPPSSFVVRSCDSELFLGEQQCESRVVLNSRLYFWGRARRKPGMSKWRRCQIAEADHRSARYQSEPAPCALFRRVVGPAADRRKRDLETGAAEFGQDRGKSRLAFTGVHASGVGAKAQREGLGETPSLGIAQAQHPGSRRTIHSAKRITGAVNSLTLVSKTVARI